MKHIGHFPTSMEMCMDDHLILTTDKIQQKQFQGKAYEQCCSTHSISPHSQKNTVLSHAKFPTGMESMPFFLGNQFLQGKGKSTLGTKLKPFMDTCKSTLGTDQQPFVDTDQKPSTSSKDTHKKERMTAMIGITLIATLRTVNMITTHILMSVHPQDTFSKKLDQLRKSTVQGNQLTRLSHYTSTGFLCDKKNLPADLHESWNDRETLSTKFRMNITLSIIHMITTQCLMSEHSSDSISNRLAQPGIHHRRSTSQDSKPTTTLINYVTEKICRQIF